VNEQTLLLWGFGLLAAGLLLIFMEVFIPSGGVIGLAAGVCALAGVVSFWRVSTTWGVTSMLVVMVLVPTALNLALRIMPHTPLGRKLILSQTQEQTDQRAVDEQAELRQAQALVGAMGVALTPMHPVGHAEIDGTRLEVLAEGGAIEAGSRVRVTSVEGNQVKVRAVV